MCGIAGIFDFRSLAGVDVGVVGKMLSTMAHRGPDGTRVVSLPGLGLGFARLGLTDLENGMQPFYNETRRILSICNGEIFNHKELTLELKGKGHILHTRSDCECLVHLYEEKGTRMFEELNGQFALALFDEERESIFLARDKMGICPLFFIVVDNQLIFASEIKALLAHKLVPRRIDLVGLDQLMTYPGLVSPRTMFEGIYSLPAGFFLTMKRGGELQMKQYWDLEYPTLHESEDTTHEEAYVDELDAILTRSIERRLAADVPVGLYLSGGLDSSIVAAKARTLLGKSQVKSFGIDFEDQLISEGQFQKLVADRYGLSHYSALFTPRQIQSRLRSMVYHCEAPVKETFNTAALSLSELAFGAGLRAVLSGQGADELFAGYVGFRLDKHRARLLKREKAEEVELCRRLWGRDDFCYEKDYSKFSVVKRRLYSQYVNERYAAIDCTAVSPINVEMLQDRSLVNVRSYVDTKLRLADHLLSGHGDRMAMANSVEVRFPFLDSEVIDFAVKLPVELKLNGMNEKYILKQLAKKIGVPRTIVEREKFGFTAPGSPYLLQQSIPKFDHYLSPEYLQYQGIFDPDEVLRLVKQYTVRGYRINVPFEQDLLISVITVGIFMELFDVSPVHRC